MSINQIKPFSLRHGRQANYFPNYIICKVKLASLLKLPSLTEQVHVVPCRRNVIINGQIKSELSAFRATFRSERPPDTLLLPFQISSHINFTVMTTDIKDTVETFREICTKLLSTHKF